MTVAPDAAVEVLARKLWAVRAGALLLERDDAVPVPVDTESAYRVADRLVEQLVRLHGPVAGYKIGAHHPLGQRQLGLQEPFYGCVCRGLIHLDSETLADLPAGATIEAEIGVRLACDLPPRAASYEFADIEAAVGGIAPLFEINRPAYREPFKVSSLLLIADNGVTQGLVVGRSMPRPGAADPWRQESLRMLRNGVECAASFVGERIDDPLQSVLWLANTLSRRGISLHANEVVATGALTPPIPFEPGDVVEVRFHSVGVLSCLRARGVDR